MIADTVSCSSLEIDPIADSQPHQAPRPTEDFVRRAHVLAGSIMVVTSSDDEDWYGLTTTSVCALSSEPPTVVACLPRRSRLARELGRTRRFCVNVPGPDQPDLADSFADPLGPASDQFVDVGWRPGSTGVPVLAGALAAFECEVDLIYSYPRDLIVVGSVRHVSSHELAPGRRVSVGPTVRSLVAG